MAAVTALTSTSICAFAEGQDSKALAKAITIAKTRLDIPEELSEFSYNTVNSYNTDSYSLRWCTPEDANEYRVISVRVTGSLILSYYDSESGWSGSGNKLAKLSGDELYKKAQEQVKKINPTVADVISIDRDSLNINVYSDRAVFSLVRTKNGIPVRNDSGSIVLDKNTGALISFSLNWHEKAAFKDAKTALSEDKAKDKYAQMIDIKPQYEFYYDWEAKEQKCRLVYRQSNYGQINAFTGKKSDFDADGYYDETMEDCAEENDAVADKGNPSTGAPDYQFTEQELAELNRELPYAGEAAIKALLQSNEYLTFKTDMELSYSNLHKLQFDGSDRYYYTASFTNESWSEPNIVPIYDDEGTVEEEYYEDVFKDYQTVSITVDAESGQILNYSYNDTAERNTDSYDLAKADTLAKDIAEKFAGDKFGEYGDYFSSAGYWTEQGGKKNYWGSDHIWKRYANDILVSGDTISIRFGSDMKLKEYCYSYTEADIPDPSTMLTEKQIMNKFWENNKLDLYYLARISDKKTKTVLVYGTGSDVYADAFTGEQIYNWGVKYENDLSGIKDKKILKMAQKLDDHGFRISAEKFSEKDAAPASALAELMGTFIPEGSAEKLTRGSALVIFTRATCGDTVPALKGIYKSPFSDVKDTDENVGYYAIAYAMGAVSGDKLDADADFTYGDMIKMVYSLYSAE